MRLKRAVLPSFLLFLFTVPLAAQAQRGWSTPDASRAVRPAQVLANAGAGGTTTEFLILGTPHLRMLGKALRPSALDSLLAVLQRFGPTMIAVEASPPAYVSRLIADGDTTIVSAFAARQRRWGRAFQARLGVRWDSAAAEADRLLGGTVTATDSVRSSALPLLLAGYDYYSALLDWAGLSKEGRRMARSVSAPEAAALDSALKVPNEIMAIAIPLGVRLGLTRLVPFDDHLDDAALLESGDLQRLSHALTTSTVAQAVTRDTFYTAFGRHVLDANRTGNLLPVYRYVNSAAYATRDVELQWGIFLRMHLASGLDRKRLALWEARNMRMAENLRVATASHPGTRVLVIVGAAHRPFLSAYLSEMVGVRVVPFDELR